MIKVQIFKPADNVKGSAYGPFLASQLEQWRSWVNTHGTDGKTAFEKKVYIANEIQSMVSALLGDMGSTAKFCPIYTIAIMGDNKISKN